MRIGIPARSTQPARGVVKRFLRDAKGVAAIEFAYLAPVLVLMLLATIETGRAINIDRHFDMATSMAGDLVAREEWLGTSSSDAQANLDGMMKSIAHIMEPYDISTLKLGIFQVRASPTDASNTKVDWTYSYNGKSVPTQCQSYTLPTGLIDKGGSVIVVEGSYLYQPLFAGIVPGITGTMSWTDKSFHSPRMNSCVDYVKPTGNGCLTSC
jgi:Flp pilus assembly protein TadG